MFISRVKKEEKTRKNTFKSSRHASLERLSHHPAAATASAISVMSQRVEVRWWVYGRVGVAVHRHYCNRF